MHIANVKCAYQDNIRIAKTAQYAKIDQIK